MNISIYYRETAAISLNGSIAALVPAGLIIVGNLLIFDSRQIMFLTIPFFMLSFVCFHFYLFRMRQSFSTERNIVMRQEYIGNSLFDAPHLLVFYHSTQSPELHFFFPNGHNAGKIERRHKKGISLLWDGKAYGLCNQHGQEVGFFKVKGKTVEVYDRKNEYLGCFGKGKNCKQLFDSEGKSICYIEGSNLFMDEKVLNNDHKQAARLRRGWMRVQWLDLFPNPNTPVLSFSASISDQDKLLIMSFLFHEFFIER
jgi:hypothetical protein